MLPQLETLFDELRRFQAAWMSHGWSWDRRFECVASTFDFSDAEEARRVVSGSFSEQWTEATIRRAPPLVADVAQSTGGVRADQLLVTTPGDRVIAYGLWWPWGGEATNISMRVGITGSVSQQDQWTLQKIFGAPDA